MRNRPADRLASVVIYALVVIVAMVLIGGAVIAGTVAGRP